MSTFFKGLFKAVVTGSHSQAGLNTPAGGSQTVKYTCPADKWAYVYMDTASITFGAGGGSFVSISIANSNLQHVRVKYNPTSVSSGTVSSSIMVPGCVILRPGDSLITIFENLSTTTIHAGACSFIIFECAAGAM